MSGKHLLEIKNIQTCFKTDGKMVRAVDGVSMYLDRGEIIGIIGESGSGKSVTMMSTLQLISSPGKITGGEVYLDGNDKNMLEYGPQSEEMRQMRGGKISMIFQEPMTSLNPVLTIGYQIQENIMLHLKLSKEEAKERTIKMLKMVNIPDAEQRYHYYPQQFSGGMRQRIMIAMALSSEPDILVADEATTALDVTTQAQLLEMIRDIAKKTNTAVIIVTHNLGIVARFAERIYVMYSGSVVETTNTNELFADPEHPYTRALLRAIPRLDDPKDRILIPIEGLPPNPATRPDYCPFYDRCEYRMDRCRQCKKPDLKEVSPGHFSACLLTDEEKAAKAKEIAAKKIKEAPQAEIRQENCLDVRNVRKYFPVYKGIMRKKVGEVKAIEEITFQARKGETLGIVGESGCGKTTLARCIMRVYQPEEGEIFFNGTDIAKFSDKQLKPYRPKISMIFQDPFSSLDPRQTAESVVGESLKLHHLVKNKEEYDARVDELFRIVGLDPALKNRVPHEFSGGQRQRIGIARALSSNPDMIICDEPISALDVSIQAQVINLLEELQAKLGLTYLFIAHDLAVVKHISDRILVMYLGRVVEIAECDELYENTLHPYTKALLAAVPVADPVVEASRDRVPIRGEVPSLTKRPSGCPFHDRCDHATERCKREVPQLKDVGMVGLILKREDWIRYAVYEDYGLLYQLEHGVRENGMWFEGTFGYHFYALEGFFQYERFAVHTKHSHIRHPLYRKMLKTAAVYAQPDFNFPMLNDTYSGHGSLKDKAELYEFAYRELRDEELLEILHRIYQDRARKGVESFFWGVKKLPEKGEVQTEKRSPALLDLNNHPEVGQTGITVLRGKDDRYLLFKHDEFGGEHDHYDRLALSFLAYGKEIAADLGTTGYGAVLHYDYYKNSGAHNTVTIGEGNHPPGKARLTRYEKIDGVIYAEACMDWKQEYQMPPIFTIPDWNENLYQGVTMTRKLAWTENYFAECFIVEGVQDQTIDWGLHIGGSFVNSDVSSGRRIMKPLGRALSEKKPLRYMKDICYIEETDEQSDTKLNDDSPFRQSEHTICSHFQIEDVGVKLYSYLPAGRLYIGKVPNRPSAKDISQVIERRESRSGAGRSEGKTEGRQNREVFLHVTEAYRGRSVISSVQMEIQGDAAVILIEGLGETKEIRFEIS